MSYNSDEIAIRVSNVTKAYKIFDTPGKRFLHHMFHTKSGRDFVALDNVSFEVKKGESFGIIGRNGSGKSTMLQILAGIIKATSGEIEVNGRIAALLELGSGFNPESTGYENIYMNAAILGVSKEEIDAKVDQIIEFADIGDFVNQPVKTYSSGMFVRLAFAVAINVDADILLIDEALAVGDVFFRQKCYKKLDELKAEGKTIILVSHGMNEVEQFCDRVLLLNKSKELMCGDSKEAVKRYYLLDQHQEKRNTPVEPRNADIENSAEQQFPENWSLRERVFFDLSHAKEISNGKVKIINVGSFDNEGYARVNFEQGETCYFYYEIEVLQDINLPLVGIVFTNQKGTIVHGKDNVQLETNIPDRVFAGTTLKCLQCVKLDLQVGEYTIEIGSATMLRDEFDNRMYQSQEEVNANMERLSNMLNAGRIAVSEKKIGQPMKNMFHGCCDLPGSISIIER